MILVGLVFLGVVTYLQQKGSTPETAFLGGVIAALVLNGFVPNRSRYIPKSERRMAIGRFESETRQKYDPQLHDLDHIVPFSKGGSNTADNLRVTTQRENRSKGAKSPWWDLFG